MSGYFEMTKEYGSAHTRWNQSKNFTIGLPGIKFNIALLCFSIFFSVKQGSYSNWYTDQGARQKLLTS